MKLEELKKTDKWNNKELIRLSINDHIEECKRKYEYYKDYEIFGPIIRKEPEEAKLYLENVYMKEWTDLLILMTMYHPEYKYENNEKDAYFSKLKIYEILCSKQIDCDEMMHNLHNLVTSDMMTARLKRFGEKLDS